MFVWLETVGVARAAEMTCVEGVGPTGLIGAVKVASTEGWRPVRLIGPGDMVLTFDAGMQPVTAVQTVPLWAGEGACPDALWPIEVPAGALGNRDLMYLAADQAVLIESDAAEALTGDPFALVPAQCLDGVRGLCRVPPPEGAEVTMLHFETEQIVFANSGAMFHCPAGGDLLNTEVTHGGYKLLDMPRARQIAASLETPTMAVAS